VINDPVLRMLCTSRHFGDEDEVPLRAGLARRAARIDVPTLVLGCEGSHVDPGSRRYIAEQVPGAELHVFGSDVANSHFPFLEDPAAFNAVVEDFLDRP